MTHYVNIMEDLDGKSDIPTDEEKLLFSETESEIEDPIELKKPPKNLSLIYNGFLLMKYT